MVTYCNDISPELSSLPGKFGEFPSVDQAVGSFVFGPILASFSEKLREKVSDRYRQ